MRKSWIPTDIGGSIAAIAPPRRIRLTAIHCQLTLRIQYFVDDIMAARNITVSWHNRVTKLFQPLLCR